MSAPTDAEVLAAMAEHGGSFARALAGAGQRADPGNLAKLKAAWPELWTRYEEVARLNGAWSARRPQEPKL